MNRAILLVDENPEVLAKISAFLEDFGFMVQTAVSRTEALGKVRAFDPGLVLVALDLSDGTALMLADELRHFLKSHAPVLVFAPAKQCEAQQRKPESRIVQAWLRWPIDQMDLYNKVNEWLGEEVPITAVAAHHPAAPAAPRKKVRSALPPPPVMATRRRREVHEAAPATPFHLDESEPDGPKPTGKKVLGNLSRLPMARLLFTMGKRRETGLLTLNRTPRQMRVHFHEGQIVEIQSNYIPDLSLGVQLAKKGDITPAELNHARKRWQQEGGLFGQMLLSLSLLNSAKLEFALVEQRIKKVLSLFEWHWQAGTFVLVRGREHIDIGDGFRLRVEPAIIEGIRTWYDHERLQQVFADKQRLVTPATVARVAMKDLVGRADPTELQRTIDAIQVGHNLTKAASISGMDETRFLQNAYALYVLDVLRFTPSR